MLKLHLIVSGSGALSIDKCIQKEEEEARSIGYMRRNLFKQTEFNLEFSSSEYTKTTPV